MENVEINADKVNLIVVDEIVEGSGGDADPARCVMLKSIGI